MVFIDGCCTCNKSFSFICIYFNRLYWNYFIVCCCCEVAMVSAFLASICGIALSTQVRMCTVTSQQLLLPYSERIEAKVQPLVQHLGNNYLANGIAFGYNLGYRRQVDFGQHIEYIEADARVTMGLNYSGLQLGWRW